MPVMVSILASMRLARKLASMNRSSGGAAGRRARTSASKLALMPSSNGAARGRSPPFDVEIVGGRCDLWRGLGVLASDRDDLVAMGGS
jgi:hypothetical protein